MSDGKNMIKDSSFLLARRIIKLYKHLTENKKEFIMSKQLLRSGTGVGALAREAQNAESKADFIHKLGIAQKECDETLYWLELLYASDYMVENEFVSIQKDSSDLLKMIRSAIITSKQKDNP